MLWNYKGYLSKFITLATMSAWSLNPTNLLLKSVATSKLSNFYIRSGTFGILSLIAALFSYALYPILAHVLSTQELGDFTVIVAFSNQLLGILLAFNVISIYLVKSQSEEKARNHAQIIQKNLVLLFITLTLALLIASPYLNKLLKIDSPGYFIILGVILLASVPNIIWTGYLQGHKELVRVSTAGLIASIAKLAFASLFAVALGAKGGLFGVLVGIVVGLLALRLIPGIKLPNLSSLFTRSNADEKQFLLKLKSYFIECVLVVGAFSILQNYDITLAKALFSPSEAGVYSGISVLSNALYFLSFLLIWIVLPEIEISKPKNNRRILGTAYKLLGLLAVLAVSSELLLKGYITGLLLGDNFAGEGSLLIFATLYQLTLVGLTLYAFYMLVMRERRAALLAGTCFISATVLPALYATTTLSMIRLMWLALLLGFAIYVILARLPFFQAGRVRRT